MTNKEINEYIAENLFGLEPKFCCREQMLYFFENHKIKELNGHVEHYGSKCYFCKNNTKSFVYRDTFIDYIENWQQVVEKLWTEITDVLISRGVKGDTNCKFFKGDKVVAQCIWSGMNIGEAVCRAAVEYLPTRNVK